MFDRGLPVWISREIGFRLVGQKGGFSQAVDAAFAVKKASEFASAETLRSATRAARSAGKEAGLLSWQN